MISNKEDRSATAARAAASSSSRDDRPAPPAAPNIVMSSKDHDSLFSGGGIRFLIHSFSSRLSFNFRQACLSRAGVMERSVLGFYFSFLSGSRNGRFSYGYSSFKGKRSSMEDFFETKISEVDGQTVAFFGVFDGHGGSRTAEYLKDNLFKNLSSHPDFIKDTKTAIVEAFKQTDVDYLNEEKGHQRDAGSTASTAMLLGDRILVANVGDSRVVASRAGTAVPLSIDHKPDRSDERQRIEEAGGFIIWAGTWRVGGVLAVSRAFGDKLLKPYVVADPEIKEEEIDGVDFIIIASDGLWNVISNKMQKWRPENSLKKLMREEAQTTSLVSLFDLISPDPTPCFSDKEIVIDAFDFTLEG
ncbi:hypothetical protein Ahy_B09g099545 isoform A [Arachis hypogaea]|uniref:protein-serine/threonine phosphatase n=1 Tax=Arachis hypogaea TaxID=3818 RepID=A0A444XU20_ARAHY|nr:hypothetical protein Ahy_B09g099545 isoform A [Arachis hypogaea]